LTGIITTIAGNGTSGYGGDGGPATSAELDFPSGLAFDASGNLYIADSGNQRIRMVTTSTGDIHTFAGTGTQGYGGDGGPATSAKLDEPAGVAFDSSGNLYIGDIDNNRIRKVNTSGVISTFAGTGTAGYSGDGNPATSAELYYPWRVAVDAAGDLYIADDYNNVIRKVDSATGIIRTVAGNGFGAGTGSGSYGGDGGPATSAEMWNPQGISIDASGNLYIADTLTDTIREVTATAAPLDFPNTQDGSVSPAQIVSVANIGNAALTFSSIAATANFQVNSAATTCSTSSTLAAGDTCLIGVDFAPTTTGTLTGALTITDNSGNVSGTKQTVQLSGTGLAGTKTSTTTSVTSSQNPSTFGESVTFTATVSPNGPPTPTGTVGFTSSGTTIIGCSAVTLSASRTAQCATTGLPVGTDLIVATYSGDSNYTGSSSSPLAQVVNKAATATALTSSQNPSTSGQAVTFTATISGGVSPSGTVSFTSNSATISACGSIALSSSEAQCTTTTLPVGSDAIVATYSGDSSNAGSSGSLTQVVNSAAGTPTTTTIVSSLNPSIVGQSVTFTATVSPSGPPTPTGTVAFASSGAAISGCTAVTLTASRTAQCATAGLPAGTDSIVATYVGDSNYVGSSSSPLAQIVSMETTTTALTSNPNPSTSGQSVTLAATVSGGASPSGTVGFIANASTISGCGSVTLSSGVAQCITSTLPVGSDAVVATYSGDSNNAGSSGSLTQMVSSTLMATTTALVSSRNPSTSGNAVTFTATVSPAGPPSPSGTVGFTANGVTITGCATVALSTSSHTAGCTSSTLAVGTDSIVATYSGDSNYSGSNGALAQLVNPVASAFQLFPVSPCRIVDTRSTDGPFGGPEIAGGTSRNFAIPSGPCAGIPPTATAYSLNVTVVPPGPLGYVTIWPTGEGQPLVSTLNSLDGRIKANAAIVPAGTSGAVSVYANNTTNVLLDINGYFQASSGASLEFYPLTPCRVADTRKTPDGPLAGPALVAAAERDFPILSSGCGIPGTAQAFSLNFTVVPPATGDELDYLTVWPEGEAKPLVSTLNNFTGTIVANAAIVPAGTDGGVAVYPSDATNLVIDVNGYFAPPGTGGLQLYTLTPCRVLDTRKTSGEFSGTLLVNVSGSTCAPPGTAQAYVFNATVVPSGALGYLTLWPEGEAQPVVSTLNAEDGAITSNMAIVPNKDGDNDAYASGTTQLVLDMSAYFAP
jgi:sugar lactone lactonase YvrE